MLPVTLGVWNIYPRVTYFRFYSVRFYSVLLCPFNTAFRPVQKDIPDQFRTVFPGEIELECGIQPGRARELYSIVWLHNKRILSNQTDFSLSVSVESVSQNGSVYQCRVEITSCSPTTSTGCSRDSRFVDGNSTTLIVEGEWISCSCK